MRRRADAAEAKFILPGSAFVEVRDELGDVLHPADCGDATTTSVAESAAPDGDDLAAALNTSKACSAKHQGIDDDRSVHQHEGVPSRRRAHHVSVPLIPLGSRTRFSATTVLVPINRRHAGPSAVPS